MPVALEQLWKGEKNYDNQIGRLLGERQTTDDELMIMVNKSVKKMNDNKRGSKWFIWAIWF